MKTVLVTGSRGFIGTHVKAKLQSLSTVRVLEHDLNMPEAGLDAKLAEADVIIHLAGVNRPRDPSDFKNGNANFTAGICEKLTTLKRKPIFILSSSIQASLENPYGISKREAEEAVKQWAAVNGGMGIVYRLKNVFGKWCRPNYNSVVATFCYNVARNIPIEVSNHDRELELVYIDDVVDELISWVDVVQKERFEYVEIAVSYRITLGDLANKILSFRDSRKTLILPALSDEFTHRLYATYLTYLDGKEFRYSLNQKNDNRGTLAEFMKAPHFGQIFVSRTNRGVTRGNHYHNTKTEKFLVLEGEAIVRLRSNSDGLVTEHCVNGRDFSVVDIPPGYTHSIENVGDGELVTLFWASEMFDPLRPDTVSMPVIGNL